MAVDRGSRTPNDGEILEAQVTVGDAFIDTEPARPGVVVFLACAGNIDGFVDDQMTEYANSSVYRTLAVRQARAAGSITTGNLMWQQHGVYYIGMVVYDRKGDDESFDVWLKDRQVGVIRGDRNLLQPWRQFEPRDRGRRTRRATMAAPRRPGNRPGGQSELGDQPGALRRCPAPARARAVQPVAKVAELALIAQSPRVLECDARRLELLDPRGERLVQRGAFGRHFDRL